MILCFYFALIGTEFWRAKWLKPAPLRALALGMRILLPFRLMLVYFASFTTVVLVHHYAAEGQATPRAIYLPVAIGVALLTELGLWYWGYRRIRGLVAAADTAVDEAKMAAVADRCTRELRWPWPERIGRNLLRRLTELRLNEENLTSRLVELADSGQFFVKSDDILEAIDRVDARRRQKALQY